MSVCLSVCLSVCMYVCMYVCKHDVWNRPNAFITALFLSYPSIVISFERKIAAVFTYIRMRHA